MSQESGTAVFSAPSPSDINIQLPKKRSKISYTREFLLSLAKTDSTVRLPMAVKPSFPCVFEDASGLLSLPFCVPDSGCHKTVPHRSSMNMVDNANHLLHRSNQPYRPPCRYKELPPSSRDGNDLVNSDTSESSESTNQERAEGDRWRKDTIRLPKEDIWYSSKNPDSQEYSEAFLISPATRNLNTLQSTSNLINQQSNASQRPSLIQGAVRGESGDALQPSILPETTEGCSTPHQHGQDLITNETVSLWQKSLNHIDTSSNTLSMLDDGMHLMKFEAYSKFQVGHPEGTSRVMEPLWKSKPPNFLSQKNHCEVEYEKLIMELKLSNTPVCLHGSPRKIAKSDLSEASVSPPPVEDEKQFISMVDECESSPAHCEGILSLQGVKQAISVSMKLNPTSPGFQIQHELELNSNSNSLDGKSNSSFELCLPDEDSLISFDGPFLMPDAENSAVVDNSMSSLERNAIEADVFSPSSPRDMVEKLVESILNDESCPAPHLDDHIVHLGAGLEGYGHPLHAQQSYTQFCSNQLNLGRDEQAHNSFHSFSSNTACQLFPLSHDELRKFHDQLRRVDHEVGQSMFQQKINPGKLHLGSLCVSQSGMTPHLPLQMASCPQPLNSMQSCTLGYQEPYWGFMGPNPDSPSNINQAVLDGLVDMNLRARHWHPYVGGF